MAAWAGRVKEWCLRYLPAEAFSFVITIVLIFFMARAGCGRLAIAFAGTWAGNITYFGYLFVADVVLVRRQLAGAGKNYSFSALGKNVRALVAEFGVAELLDSLLIRPALMYYVPLWVHSIIAGSVIAKFAADVTFYIPAIISYELTKKKFRKFH